MANAWQKHANEQQLPTESDGRRAASAILCNCKALLHAHRQVEVQLETLVATRATASAAPKIAPIFSASLFETIHRPYLHNLVLAQEKLRKERLIGSEFVRIADAALQSAPSDLRLTLESAIGMPLEHARAQVGLLTEALRQTAPESASESTRLAQALHVLARAVRSCEKEQQAERDMAGVLDLANTLQGAERVPLVRRGRCVQSVHWVDVTLNGDLKRSQLRRLWLCNDILVLASSDAKDKDARTAKNALFTFTKLIDLHKALVRDYNDVPNSVMVVDLREKATFIFTFDSLGEKRACSAKISANIKALIKSKLKHRK